MGEIIIFIDESTISQEELEGGDWYGDHNEGI